MSEIINQIITFLIILAGVWIIWQVATWLIQTITFTPEMFQDFVTQEQPTLVYFFSRNCPLCKPTRKAVFYVMVQLEKEAQLLLINTSQRGGMEIAQEYGVSEVPTCMVFNTNGTRTYTHTGLPDVDVLIKELNSVKNNG